MMIIIITMNERVRSASSVSLGSFYAENQAEANHHHPTSSQRNENKTRLFPSKSRNVSILVHLREEER